MEIWVLLIDHNFQAIGSPFLVDSTGIVFISHLTERVKEKKPGVLSRTNTDPSDLTVWRCIDPTTFDAEDSQILKNQISEACSNKRVKELNVMARMAKLNISENEILFVKLPGQPVVTSDQVGSPITLQVDREYEHCFLRARSNGGFTEDDIEFNGIMDRDDDDGDAPEFVKKYEQMLGRKRNVADNIRGAAERVVGGEDYFDYSTANVSAVVVEEEVIHLSQISSLYWAEHWETRNHGKTRLFKECDANWLFFFPIARRINSRPSSIATGTPRLSARLGQEPWPFQLIIKVEERYHTYKPKSDFLALKFGLPRMAVEVNSTLLGQSAVDHHRMIIQGASVVRFANTTLDTYKNEKNFVFVAIYISGDGQADRHLLYQKEGSNDVFRNLRTFVFANRGDRIAFALELYNFCSALADESDNGDTGTKVKKLATTVKNFGTEHRLQAFTSKSKRTANDDGGNQPERNVRHKGGDGGADEQLEAYGYEVVPDILETEGGTWELIDKVQHTRIHFSTHDAALTIVLQLPPNIRTVYRQSDRNKTELIAKHLRKGSKELDILKYLHTIQPQSPHVISLIETIPSTTGGWLILPKLHSICYQEVMNSRGVRGRDQLGRGLIEGLGYLHEHGIAHRDIKPGNLVCDDDFCLQIIDFDVAIEVQDENTEVDKYRGTRDWTAPEMGEEGGPRAWYSPIKADRWSCGRVLLRHILVGKGDNRLSRFASQLMSRDPEQRPSLIGWSAVLLSDKGKVLTVRGKDSRPREEVVDVDGVSIMEAPDAKKPRLSVTSEVSGELKAIPTDG